MNDHELLQGYVQRGSQGDFAQLVERHVNLVYSTARRVVSDGHLAEDVTQQVFTLLARKAGRLGHNTILSAWLYRAARHVASETMRRQFRRTRREKLAVEFMNPSTHDAAWERIEPLLDEAMAGLRAADHDALVLRYFENKSLKEVGAALGSSEDAAQKRITRALDKLRTNLARRGVTVSVTALAAAIAGGAVQSAPIGLAASTASASLAAGVSASLISNCFQFMATSNVKLVTTTVIIATLAISLVLVRNQNATLRRELAALRPPARVGAHLSEIKGAFTESGINGDELRRLRLEHLELLSLRGRVTQLANEMRQIKVAGSYINAAPDSALNQKEADSTLFTAALTNRVSSGHTLVVGGWSKDGMRGYLLATPVLARQESVPDGRRLTVKSQVVGAPESFWEQIGWGAYKSETRRSALAGVLSPEQLKLLLNALKETKGARLSNTSSSAGTDGERMGFGFYIADDQESGALMGIDIYPQITSDGQSVDLAFSPSVVSGDTPIHSSLKPAP